MDDMPTFMQAQTGFAAFFAGIVTLVVIAAVLHWLNRRYDVKD